jgi:hypothetical protein
VNCHLGRNSKSPILSLLSEFESTSSAANAINEFLLSVFIQSRPINTDDNSLLLNGCQLGWLPDASPSIVKRHLDELCDKKSSPDLPHALYKSISAYIAPPLSKLFRTSLEQGSVPKAWKQAIITPVPKTKTPSLHDIRPISLLSPPAKILEKIVLMSLKDRLISNYDTAQFGFRPKSSTLCALSCVHEQVTRYLDDPSTFGALIITYDYSKAFDRLRADIIVQRMVDCKFPVKAVQWVHDYLSDRSQIVQIGQSKSNIVMVTSGVPQGSILGPFLYSFATSTFKASSASCTVVKYADDTSLIFPLWRTGQNEHIEQEHKNLLHWSELHDLKMNVAKCKALTFRKPNAHQEINLLNISEVNALNILGIIFNKKCSWTDHIDHLVKKCSRLLFAFRLIRGKLGSDTLKRIYYSLVRSLIDYCAPVYVGLSATDANRLERIQSRFHRIICNPLCKESCLVALDERRSTLSTRFLEKVMDSDHVLHSYLPPLSKSGRFILPYRRTTRRSRSFFLKACEKYNSEFKR